MRGHLGGLRHDGGIEVANIPARGAHTSRSLLKQGHGISAFELWLGIGKMTADVPQCRRPQQGVGDGMEQGVGIGVAEQPMGMGNGHTTQNQRTVQHQGVGIPAFPHTQGGHIHDGLAGQK